MCFRDFDMLFISFGIDGFLNFLEFCTYLRCFDIIKHYRILDIQGELLQNPRGVGILFHFSVEASLIQNSTLDLNFTIKIF